MTKAKTQAINICTGTQLRPTDENGRELDVHGLPLNGPARLRALAGRPDPNLEPEAFALITASSAEKEAGNG
jgi:hypothetical protein